MSELAPESAGQKFQRLVEIMALLRGPGGCPWDREQTFDTIKPYLLEETYEVMDSIDARDWNGLADELGDLLLQSVFFAQMAAEENRFRIEDALDAINGKLIRRHPHVFAGGSARTPGEVKQRWDEIKTEELRQRGRSREGLLDGVSRALPALVEAQQISSKASRTGFDWQNAGQIVGKLHEELAEMEEARASGDRAGLEHEIGDLLGTLVNLARFLDLDAEQALRGANARFRRRFGYIERRLAERGRPAGEATLEEMDALWEEAKAVEETAGP